MTGSRRPHGSSGVEPNTPREHFRSGPWSTSLSTHDALFYAWGSSSPWSILRSRSCLDSNQFRGFSWMSTLPRPLGRGGERGVCPSGGSYDLREPT